MWHQRLTSRAPRRWLVLITLLVLSANLGAQPTWHGLRFGMTESEAKLKLGGAAKRPDPLPEEGQRSQTDYPGWILSIAIEDIPGEGVISFDKVTHRLARVTLVLNSEKMKDVSDNQWVNRIRRSLEDKYGRPFRREKESIDSRTTWRLKDQILELQTLETSDGSMQLVFIDYKLVTGKL